MKRASGTRSLAHLVLPLTLFPHKQSSLWRGRGNQRYLRVNSSRQQLGSQRPCPAFLPMPRRRYLMPALSNSRIFTKPLRSRSPLSRRFCGNGPSAAETRAPSPLHPHRAARSGVPSGRCKPWVFPQPIPSPPAPCGGRRGDGAASPESTVGRAPPPLPGAGPGLGGHVPAPGDVGGGGGRAGGRAGGVPGALTSFPSSHPPRPCGSPAR